MSGTLEPWFDLALKLAGAGHFCVLLASLQVPNRLGWRDDLAKLRPFNRKLMWVYGGFTVLTILAFGALTLLLRREMLAGDRAAVCLAGFIGTYWAARIAVDFLFFSHDDWPRGPLFKLGHALLVSLFIALAGTYLGLVAYHVIGR